MSRSRKKRNWVTDNSWKKFGKKYANKKVRRTDDIRNGSSYKKHFESYNICDYKWLSNDEKDRRK